MVAERLSGEKLNTNYTSENQPDLQKRSYGLGTKAILGYATAEQSKPRGYYKRLQEDDDKAKPRVRDLERLEIYDKNEIELDLTTLEEVKDRRAKKELEQYGYVRSEAYEEMKQSRKMELIVKDLLYTENWFSEWDFDSEKDPEVLTTHPTAEIDDNLNHVDVICTFGNEITGEDASGKFKILPFAVDFTCIDDNPGKIQEKFSWGHTFGRTDESLQNVTSRSMSEFKLSPNLKKGLGIPGVASVKYFLDKSKSGVSARLPAGRIEMMPKLVLGADKNLATYLAEGKPGSSNARDDQIYQIAASKLKWCILTEGEQQARLQYQMLTSLKEGPEGRDLGSDGLDQAIQNAGQLMQFFRRALNKANQLANSKIEQGTINHTRNELRKLNEKEMKIKAEKVARGYANGDAVCKLLKDMTIKTYQDQEWRKLSNQDKNKYSIKY